MAGELSVRHRGQGATSENEPRERHTDEVGAHGGDALLQLGIGEYVAVHLDAALLHGGKQSFGGLLICGHGTEQSHDRSHVQVSAPVIFARRGRSRTIRPHLVDSRERLISAECPEIEQDEYYGMAAPGRAKLAHLAYNQDLAERLRDSGVSVFAADPEPRR